MTWATQHARTTLFLGAAATDPSVPSFRQLVGAEPDNEVRNPGAHQQSLRIDRTQWVYTKTVPSRIDLIAAGVAPDDPTNANPADQSVGTPKQAFDVIADASKKLIESGIAVVRLAVGLHLLWPTKNRDESYDQIVQLIKTTNFELAGASEFQYQINRPREATSIAKLKVNRLSKWACIKSGFMAIDPTGQRLIQTSEHHAVKLEIDINSDAEMQEVLVSNDVVKLWNEFTQLALEIAEKGDVK